MPRVGYRLILPVEEVAPPAPPEAPPAASRTAQPTASPEVSSGFRRLRAAAAGFVLFAAGAAVAWQWQREHPAQKSRLAVERAGELSRRGDERAAATELKHAIDLDPRNARAYSALAHAILRQSFHDSLPPPGDQSPSLEAAARAVALDPRCGECQGTLGFFLFYQHWRWDRAETHLREAMRLAPERESIRPAFAMLLAATGRRRRRSSRSTRRSRGGRSRSTGT